jgi:hypothetical protein
VVGAIDCRIPRVRSAKAFIALAGSIAGKLRTGAETRGFQIRHLRRLENRHPAIGRERVLELPGSEFALRQRARLIAIRVQGAFDRRMVRARRGKDLGSRAAGARHLHVRRRDAQREIKLFLAGIRAGDSQRQGDNPFGHAGIERRRPAQTVARGVTRRAGPSLGRSRPVTQGAVAAAGLASRFADHYCSAHCSLFVLAASDSRWQGKCQPSHLKPLP